MTHLQIILLLLNYIHITYFSFWFTLDFYKTRNDLTPNLNEYLITFLYKIIHTRRVT